MTKFLWLSTFLLLAGRLLAQSLPVCDVRQFGAKGDGVTLDTAAVSSAISSCVKRVEGPSTLGQADM